MDLQIDGDATLVTASSGGLGKASAATLAREGANVVVNGRDPNRLEATVEELRAEATGEVLGKRGDLTDPEDIEELVEFTVEEFGGLDHLVTSAGGPPSGPFLGTDPAEWQEAFELLVMSVANTVWNGAPYLREDGGGTIVTVASRSVKEAIDSLVLSNAVRMSVVGLEKTLSMELAPEVRANAVLPGPHETQRIRNLVEAAVERGEYASYEAGLAARAEGNPLERLGDPEEFGDVVAYLSSPRSSYVNGTALTVDGGGSASNL